MSGRFISFEGIDGAGKSTHIGALEGWLRQRGQGPGNGQGEQERQAHRGQSVQRAGGSAPRAAVVSTSQGASRSIRSNPS